MQNYVCVILECQTNDVVERFRTSFLDNNHKHLHEVFMSNHLFMYVMLFLGNIKT